MPRRFDAPARALNRLLNRFGFQISRYSNTTLQAAFERLALRPVLVNTVLDVGASDGRWSEKIFRYYSDAFYMLVDANAVHRTALDHFKQKYPRSDYILAAAGNADGVTYFYTSDPLGGVATNYAGVGAVEVPMVSLDSLVTKRGLSPPFLIKLDTHGFEVQILEGARETLLQTNLIVMETYNFPITPDSLKFYEMCALMEKYGFRPIDIIDPMHRPLDGVFWQVDLMFTRDDSDVFKSNLFK
jgi:FkbM family methyltransferase